jgi:hypothetical protein
MMRPFVSRYSNHPGYNFWALTGKVTLEQLLRGTMAIFRATRGENSPPPSTHGNRALGGT